MVASIETAATQQHGALDVGALLCSSGGDAPGDLPFAASPCLLSLLDAAPGAIVLTATLDGDLLYLNAEGRKLFCGDAITPMPFHLDRLFAERDRPLLHDAVLPACLRTGRWCGEIALRGRDGEEIPVMQTFAANRMRKPDGECTVLASIAWDLRQQKAVEQTLRRQATHDALTDCPNRALLMDRLAQAALRAERCRSTFGVVFADLDGFKRINDTFGHEQANSVLREFSERLRSQVRAEDTVARYGGDEFVVVLPDLNGVRDVERVIRKIKNVTSEPFAVAGTQVRAAVSIGVAVYPTDGTDPETLLRTADAKMYQAKTYRAARSVGTRAARIGGTESAFFGLSR